MDPLSAVTSVIAVVQIADRIATLCKAYITGVHDAPADLRAILIEVGSVKCDLEVIDLLDFSGTSDEKVKILEKLRSPLEACREALTSLEALFPPQPALPAKGKRERLALSLSALAWPFKRDKALKLLGETGRYKSTIIIGFTAEGAQDLKHIKRNTEKIQQTTSDTDMDRILMWLITTDPSPNHNDACQLHEEHTGHWLTNLTEYSKWKAGSLRFLWLHGIPGACKTVLLSYIAEDVKEFCQRNEDEVTGWAYYYCYFARDQDETHHFLRWIISQLCRQVGDLSSEVRRLFRTGRQPTTSELLDTLDSVTKDFSRVYVTIDALDESMNREEILGLLCTVVEDERFNRVQLLVTSRKELNIERALSNIGADISLSNRYVDADIRTYATSRLRKESKFSRWPETLKEEIELGLVKGAKGMFRWAVCQLDILKRLNSAPDIRLALKTLPKTLDETYERILCNMLSEQHEVAHRALHVIASGYMITLDELSDLLVINLEDHSFDPENRLLDAYAPLEACMGLVTHSSETGILTLAHYTVKEYLVSSRIWSSPAKTFGMSEESIYLVTGKFYSIPLWILQSRKRDWIERFKIERDISNERYAADERIEALEDLLKSYGARSLHLFPVKGLPGYVAEDMEEWNILNGLSVSSISMS